MMTGWRVAMMAAAAAAMQATGARAHEVTPLEDMVELREANVLAQLCREVKVPSNVQSPTMDPVEQRMVVAQQVQSRRAALERIYVVMVPSDRYIFADYDLDEGRLMVSTQGGFHTLRGALGLWSTDSEPLEVPMVPAAAREAVTAKKRGELLLKLYVHLDADPDELEQDSLKGDPCATRPGTQSYQLAVTWLGGELLDVGHKKALASFATEAGRQTPALAQRLLGC